jgi:predicted AAA+ superfamily ATPase
MPSLFPLLRALVDMERRAGRFIILGSASPSLIRNSSETLAGRIAYTELAPISSEEIESVDITINEHWLRGGFPEALLARRNHNASRWLQQFIETFIYRDLGELNYNVNANVIRKLLEMLAILNGNILNMSNLSRSLGVTQPTIARYLDILEGGFIIRRLEPYYINAKKRVVKSPKIYIRDSGVLHNILNIKNYDELISNPAIGASWEGYVVEELYRKYYNKGWRFYFYRTHKGAEADLLAITENGEKICIEIKFSESAAISRGFYETIEDIKANRSYVVVLKGIKTPKKKGVILYNIKEALKEI